MIYTAHDILTKYNKCTSIKSTWDTEYRQVFEYCMPSRDGYQKAQGSEKITPDFQDRRENLYSSAGEQAANEFVNRFQGLMFPPQSNWIDMEAGAFVKDKDEANEELAKMSEIANEYKNASNFDVATSEVCYDVFAGTGCLLVLPGGIDTPLTFKAIPLREYCIEEGINGEVSAVYRNFQIKRELLPHQWSELRGMKIPSGEAQNDVEIIETTYYDYDLLIWHYVVVDKSEEKILLEREYKTNPFVVLRWNKMAGEPYGRGPGLTALNDIKTLNLVKEYGLRNLAYAIPPLLVQEDAMLDIDSLEFTPMSLSVVPSTDSSVVPLALSTDFSFTDFKVQELQMDIKRNTLGSTLPNEGNRQLTATEVLERKAELSNDLTGVFGRLMVFQLALVRRIFDVLSQSNKISKEFDVGMIDGIIYKLKINTPISKQLQANEAFSTINAISLVSQLDPSGQMLQSLLKMNDIGVHLMDILGVPNKFINTPEEVETKQRQMTEAAQAQQQGLVQEDVDAANAKEMGKAQAEIVKNES
ncbi:MAG: hypothetical protein GY861_15990 [bacterium]|nr:hypothetical protein [bacterium]